MLRRHRYGGNPVPSSVLVGPPRFALTGYAWRGLCHQLPPGSSLFAGLPEEVDDALTGHKSTSIGRKYGSAGIPLKWLAEEVGKLQFPTVNVPAAAQE